MKNMNNVLKFENFDNNWKPKTQKSTKKTDVGLDILNEDKIYFPATDYIEFNELRKYVLNDPRCTGNGIQDILESVKRYLLKKSVDDSRTNYNKYGIK